MMPKISLGVDAKREAKELAENRILSNRLHEVTRWKSLASVADEVGLHAATITEIHHHPEAVGKMKLENVRRVAHACNLSKADWDRLGGYE